MAACCVALPVTPPAPAPPCTCRRIAEGFLCPIKKELPLDPVIAEDGFMYERGSIEMWLQHRSTSPITNLPIGERLLPALQCRSAIEELVRSGLVDDLADSWIERIRHEATVAEIRRRAEAGEVDAMLKLGAWHHTGQMGLPMSHAEGFRWCRRAAELGSLYAYASAGLCLVGGRGVDADVPQGLSLISAAAVGGLEFASNWLGEWFLAGQYGLPKDPSRAAYWFAKVVDGAAHSLDGAACPRVRGHRERAAERLSLLSAICTPAGPEEALPECIKGEAGGTHWVGRA